MSVLENCIKRPSCLLKIHELNPHKMKVDIEISSGATPIPLTRNTDFNGCTFCVEPAKYQL